MLARGKLIECRVRNSKKVGVQMNYRFLRSAYKIGSGTPSKIKTGHLK
jgi:hypothetical protein